MEQRAHIRHGVDLAGTLATSGTRCCSCRITDFCLGGVFALVPEHGAGPLRGASRGDSVALSLEVSGSRGPRTITLPAKVARLTPDGLGLAFDKPNPSDLLTLQNHVRALRDGTETRKTRGFSTARAQSLVERTVERLNEFLLACLKDFFQSATTLLAEEAGRISDNQLRQPWLEALEGLKRHQDELASRFIKKAATPLRDCLNTGNVPEDPFWLAQTQSSSRLALVDKELFEDWLTLKVMASRAEGRLQGQLLPLQLRFDELLGLGVRSRRNPLHPAVIASAFGEALKLVPVKGKTDRTILKVFERSVLDQLKDFYRDINRSLAAAGVLPDLDVGRYLSEHYTPRAEQTAGRKAPSQVPAGLSGGDARAGNPPAPPPGPAQAPTPSGAPSSGSAGNSASAFAQQQRIANQAYDSVRRLLQAGRSGGLPAGNAATAPQPAVSAALEVLQRTANEPADEPLPRRVQQAVNEKAGEERALDSEIHAASEVIYHLFEGIASNPALSDRVRDSIKRLEVPFLRLLLQDEAFLHQERHPARQMLNRIAHLGVRGNPNLAKYEHAIDRQVNDILDRFSSDINVFEETLGKLDKLAAQQSHLYQRNLSRVTEAYEGRQKLVVARREVNQALERRIGGKRVPRALLALIDAGWRQLLVQTLLRRGRDSQEWHQYLHVLDQMQEAAEITPSQEDLTRLLGAIKAGLAQVDETRVKDPALVGELRRLLSVQVRDREGPPPEVEVPAGMVNASEPDERALGESERRWRRRARRCEVGEWFEIHAPGNPVTEQIRLSWVGADRDLFVFVNHQGLRVQEYPLEEFASHLESGEMRPIDSLDAPAVDRGLEQMVQRVYDQMAHQATHDELTGLFNRREFQRQVRRRLGVEETARATLVHFDVDQFKVVNNIGGQEAGDQLLRELGSLAHEVLPGTLMARLAGDAFALWLEGVSEEAALRAVRSLCEQVERHRFQHEGQTHVVTLSCGLVHRQGPEDTASNLMQAAEEACQTAKESGRNRIQLYRADDQDILRRDDVMVWVTRLNEALDNDRLELRCQRIEPTRRGGVGKPAYEILIAIRTDQGELIPPTEFVQAAERYNRMHALDRWVIRNVLQWMHANGDILRGIDHISINLSGHSLNDVSLLEFLFDHFRRYPVPRGSLCFEVTETTAIGNLEDAADFIRALQDLGCRFSLDDFGSGLASYGYLKHLPVDFIKIDGSFIRDIMNGPADLALVRSINEMGHLMGKRTIAEYVETDEIRQTLEEIGVDFVQGFGVEEPRPLASLRQSMATESA